MKSLYFLSIGLMLFACQTSVKKEVQAEVVPSQAHDAEARLQELGIVLPEVGVPVANYVNTVRTGNLVFTSGKGPKQPDGTYVGIITIYQRFEGIKGDDLKYVDTTKKDITVYVKRKETQIGGRTIGFWDVLLGDIRVAETTKN